MDKETGLPYEAGGSIVTASAVFTPASSSGTVDVTFSFLDYSAAGKTFVVFEELYCYSIGDTPVTDHKDINDTDQTIYVTKVQTTAGKTDDGYITDVVRYENLTPGKTYTIKGTLMSKETHTPIMKDGSPVTAETAFTAPAASGMLELTFSLKQEDLREIAVVFEGIYLEGHLVAQHKDYGDEEQTVLPDYGRIELEYTPDEPGTDVVIKRPQTGYESYLEMLMDNMGILWVILASVILMLFFRKKKGLKVISVLLAALMMFSPAFAFAAGDIITKETVFETLDENGETQIDNTITTDDGLTYEVDEIRYEIVEKTPSKREVITITGVTDKESVRSMIEPVNEEGLEAEFDTIEFEENVRPKATANFTVLAGDDIPEKRTVSVSANGETFSVEVLLKSKTLNTASREKEISIPAKFWGNEHGYVIGDEIVSVSEDSPCFSGYETKILEVLGLDPDLYTITGGSWDGPMAEENGKLLRKATFKGTAKESYDYYSCYYEEDVNAAGRKFPVSYEAKVTYSNGIPEGETQYTIKAVATYKKVVATYVNETTEEVTSFFTPLRIGAGVGGLAVIAGAIAIAKKKKDEKDAAAYFNAAENGDLKK